MPQKNEERLQKYLAECGVASRRKSEELIAAGKVKVNGHVAQIGDKIDPRRDLVTELLYFTAQAPGLCDHRVRRIGP